VTIPIGELWYSRDPAAWDAALERYWHFVHRTHREMERAMEDLDRETIRGLTPDTWFAFLHDKYFWWKYTAPNRYATTTAVLRRKAAAPSGRAALDHMREELVSLDPTDITGALQIAWQIPGLGPSGASGLLALLYPQFFGTADQFVVKALRAVPDLPESDIVARMKPGGLGVRDADVLIRIMRRQAGQLSNAFGTTSWTPRAIDKVLWTYGRT
jgi:hypothetical protein